MTSDEALAAGRLAEAIAIQTGLVDAAPDDVGARRLLADLLALAGRFGAAVRQLQAITDAGQDWEEIRESLVSLMRAARRRESATRKPRVVPLPPPGHLVRRWRAIHALDQAKPEAALRHIDAADSTAPLIRGFIDGQEFSGLRDADDRFASVLETFRDREYVWYAWESVRKVALAPPSSILDRLFRPAIITLKWGETNSVRLPLTYPYSHLADDVFALGMETDYFCPDGGPTRCIGAKVIWLGDGEELALGGCRMIEVK